MLKVCQSLKSVKKVYKILLKSVKYLLIIRYKGYFNIYKKTKIKII